MPIYLLVRKRYETKKVEKGSDNLYISNGSDQRKVNEMPNEKTESQTCEHCDKTTNPIIKLVDGVETVVHEPLITLSNGNKYCTPHYNEDGIYLAVSLAKQEKVNK